MARTIGIRHRRKKTREGEARPTMVAIKEKEDIVVHKLEDDTAELDFLMARFPIAWRNLEPDEEIEWFWEKAPNGIRAHHCKWRRVKRDEDVTKLSENHLRQAVDARGFPITQVVTKLPTQFDGLKPEDKVVMTLGGSGDRFAFALSRRGEEFEPKALVHRIPPFSLDELRGALSKEEDHVTLIHLFEKNPDRFYQVHHRDRNLIILRSKLRQRMDTLKDRIACEQRILDRAQGEVFLNEEGYYPEGELEDYYSERKANDIILKAVLEEEDGDNKELEQAIGVLPVWEKVFSKVEGCGPRVAAGLVSAICDIRRFQVLPDYNGADDLEVRKKCRNKALNKSKAKLKAYCGVHVLSGGKYGDRPAEKQFPRLREGEVANWAGVARQSLVLLAKQFNYRPKSEWGQRLLRYKLALREKHPDVIEVEVKIRKGKRTVTEKRKRYTNGHIHKMAMWRTLTRFVEWLYREWMKIEKQQQEAGD